MNHTQQVKSKKRVADHGEVFTNEREVNAMLDLVNDQCQRLEATFLEPACGDGNFLIEILSRKIQLLNKYKRNKEAYSKYLVVAVSSIYGVELLEDNAQSCRERLYKKIHDTLPACLKNEAKNPAKTQLENPQSISTYSELMQTIRFILQKNIICGNALDYTDTDGNAIIFYEWKFINATDVKIRCFDFEVVAEKSRQLSLFSDNNTSVSIAKHNQEFQPIHYLKLYTYAQP